MLQTSVGVKMEVKTEKDPLEPVWLSRVMSGVERVQYLWMICRICGLYCVLGVAVRFFDA